MSTLAFKFGPSGVWNDHQVRLLIDDSDVLQRMDESALGLDPDDFFTQPALFASGDLLIGRCSCGCLGCDDEHVRTVHEAGSVLWQGPHACISGVLFDRQHYLTALAQARADTSWETVERTAERLVNRLDFSVFAGRGMTFQWASGRYDKSNVTLSFLEAGKQELISVDWDHRDPVEAERAVKNLIKNMERG